MIRALDGVMPKIHDSAFVSEFAYVIGDVEIGPGSSIWPGTVIRADMGAIKIGKFTCIQDNSVVHGDSDVLIGDNVVIGHRVLCHAAIIETRCLIGNGAVLNDGVKIGTGSLVGSSSMLLENTEIPSGSLVVGSPGRVRGDIQSKHLDLIDHTVEDYVNKGKRYLASGL